MARALVAEPAILLGDEPTGNLDSQTTLEIMALFDQLHAEGHTLLLVTHEAEIAEHCDRSIRLVDGQIVEDRRQVGRHARH
ncbi:MAG: ABC transporter ATP-binding protein [Xanthomonadales bacterium]|nr:ABC transporter ATP-binding protein [Xanthomonadales bacterium]